MKQILGEVVNSSWSNASGLENHLVLDWILNRNYTNHGIGRFREPDWAYAKRVPSGAMVGYWQSMEAIDILSEVHEESRSKFFPDLVLMGTWKIGEISRLEHTFDRTFEISPFRLYHLWIDLRSGTSTG